MTARASENWDAFYYPLGDAREALLAFAALLTDIAMNCESKAPVEF